MFEVKENIAKIVENGDKEDMEELADILEETISFLDDNLREKYENYIYVLANGYELNRTKAEKIVKCMKPIGQHWSIEETTSVKNQYGFTNISDIDFYVVMNSAYNDYRNIFKENLEIYAYWSKAFIEDEDAKEGKVFRYFTEIPKE